MKRLTKIITGKITETDKNYNSIFRTIFKELPDFEDKESLFRLIEYLYINIGNILNKRELSNRTRISFQQLEEFFLLLKKYKLFFKILPFFTNSKDENSLHFKVYANDIYLIEFIEKRIWKEISHGHKIENIVYTSLKKLPYSLRTYRKICGNEIDFILLDKDTSIIPIEVKSGNSVSIHNGFSDFLERYENKIKYFVKTTKDKKQRKHMLDKTIYFVPFDILNEFIIFNENIQN